MTKKKRADQLDEETETVNTPDESDGNALANDAAEPAAADDDTEDETSVTDRLDVIEHQLQEIKLLLTDEGKQEADRNKRMAQDTRVPYIPPELPVGLSPNELINHPVVRRHAANPDHPVAAMDWDPSDPQQAQDYLDRQQPVDPPQEVEPGAEPVFQSQAEGE
jgi:hypothetical protein